MNVELEMKFFIDSSDALEAKVLDLGFEFVKEKKQLDYYYSPAHKNFAGTKNIILEFVNKTMAELFLLFTM
jgi:predicted adenylyl cyclase CyaB